MTRDQGESRSRKFEFCCGKIHIPITINSDSATAKQIEYFHPWLKPVHESGVTGDSSDKAVDIRIRERRLIKEPSQRHGIFLSPTIFLSEKVISWRIYSWLNINIYTDCDSIKAIDVDYSESMSLTKRDRLNRLSCHFLGRSNLTRFFLAARYGVLFPTILSFVKQGVFPLHCAAAIANKEAFLLFGLGGSGKTTTLKALTGQGGVAISENFCLIDKDWNIYGLSEASRSTTPPDSNSNIVVFDKFAVRSLASPLTHPVQAESFRLVLNRCYNSNASFSSTTQRLSWLNWHAPEFVELYQFAAIIDQACNSLSYCSLLHQFDTMLPVRDVRADLSGIE